MSNSHVLWPKTLPLSTETHWISGGRMLLGSAGPGQKFSISAVWSERFRAVKWPGSGGRALPLAPMCSGGPLGQARGPGAAIGGVGCNPASPTLIVGLEALRPKSAEVSSRSAAASVVRTTSPYSLTESRGPTSVLGHYFGEDRSSPPDFDRSIWPWPKGARDERRLELDRSAQV